MIEHILHVALPAAAAVASLVDPAPLTSEAQP